MTIKETISNYYNKEREKPREVGHFFASELWAIHKRYTTVGNFFKDKTFDKEGMANMFRGSAMEDMLAKILKEQGVEFKDQERFEMEVSTGIFISGKTDFSFPDKILETKRPKEPTFGIPDKWKFQMEFYHRASGKPVYLGIFAGSGEEIIRFYKYEPKQETWETIIKTVVDFNNKLLTKYKKDE